MAYGPMTSMPAWVRRRIFQREIGLSDFSGGLNLRDAAAEIANNESPDCLNVTLDERGGIQKRLGYVAKNPSPYTSAAAPQLLFEWISAGHVLTQCGPSLFLDDATAAVYTFTTSDRCALAEFAGSLYAVHPVDGMFVTADGVTWTLIVGAPKGTCLEAWQSRLLSCGDPGNPYRLSASAIGDPLNWSTVTNDRSGTDLAVTGGSATVTSATAAFVASDVGKQILIATAVYHIQSVTNSTTAVLTAPYSGLTGTGVAWAISGTGWFNNIREHDQQPLVAIHSASGLDIAGRPGVLVFKQNSTYRVYDSSSGAYQTIDTSVGAAGPLAVTTLFSETFVVHPTGIYQTNGLAPLALASSKLQPLFADTQIAFAKASLFCAGAIGDRVHFSVPNARSTVNNLHIEYHPQQGWMVLHDDAASCYLTYTASGTEQRLYGGSPTVAGQVWRLGYGGSDNGAAISCRYQTKWLAPSGGIETRFRRLRVFARGTFNAYVKLDFDPGAGALNQVVLNGSGAVWGADLWGASNWGPGPYESHQDFWSLGKGTYISFVLTETSTTVSFAAPRTGVLDSVQQGAFALYALALQTIPISI